MSKRKKESAKSATKWHQIFGAVLQEHLHPVGIEVRSSVQISPDPPEADILLLQRQKASHWTPEQMSRLPDGIRDSNASRIIIEFKYTESVNRDAFYQLISYLYSYRQTSEFARKNTLGVMVSSMSTEEETLTKFGYTLTDKPGVYRSSNPLLNDIPLLLLNDLSNEPHNLLFKLFASRLHQKQQAMNALEKHWRTRLSHKLGWLIDGLSKLWFNKGVLLMEAITPELLIEQGKQLYEVVWATTTNEDLAKIYGVQELILQAEREVEQRVEQRTREEEQQKRRRQAIKYIRQTLAIRFGTDLTRYDQHLDNLDLVTLEELNDKAFIVADLAEFEAKLKAVEQDLAT